MEETGNSSADSGGSFRVYKGGSKIWMLAFL